MTCGTARQGLAGLLAWFCLGVTAMAAPPVSFTAASQAWTALSAAQREALGPLQRDWPALEAQRRQKWLEVAARFNTMPADEQARVRERMTEWARMTPAERARARLQFQEARQVPPEERQARWEQYQSLSAEEKQKLALRTRPHPSRAPAVGGGTTSTPPNTAAIASGRAGPGAPKGTVGTGGNSTGTAKANLVQTVTLPPARSVAPAVVMARPGATTNHIGSRAAPPAHNQTGLPKISATPGFVDATTLLPQRGPQGAAARPAGRDDTPRTQ